jgi:A/G-specific adenine glycosylase
VETLAAADIQTVLKAWEGLGYYSRARNLHKAAGMVLSQFNGKLPSDYRALQTLSGFGPYIAAAVTSIAFEHPVPVVDGNVLRVFARVWGISEDIRLPKVRDQVFAQLTPIIAHAQPSQFNQAIMELGALICTPKSPKCGECPMNNDCVAFLDQKTDLLPYKSKKTPVPHLTIGVGVIWNDGKLLIARRREDQMLGGLWEFPGGKKEDGESIETTVLREIEEELGIAVSVGYCYTVVKHAYTHFKMTLHAFKCTLESGTPQPKSSDEIRWVTLDELPQFPFPKANIKVIEAITQGLPL